MMVDFQPSMLGTAVQILGFAGAVIASHYALKSKVDVIGVKLSNLETITSNMSSMLRDAAVQSERLNRLDKDIRDIKHGRGFIGASVDGEYTRHGKLTRDTD